VTTLDTIRAWKYEDYRLSLSEEQRAQLPAHPASAIELTDVEQDIARWERNVVLGAAWAPAMPPGC
jgi:mersacidin/lichenicidin family type 2 lantibiotic